jgi:choline dehydrogenase-like flavoprotein
VLLSRLRPLLEVARLDHTQCDNDRRSIAFAKRTIRGILDAAGAQDVLGIDRYAHLVGGARMSARADDGVCDADHRIGGVPNVFVTDGSAVPTQGAANPALTIMAESSRVAEVLARKRVGAGGRSGDPAADGRRRGSRLRTTASR